MTACPHDTLERVDMSGCVVVWASDREPLDPQPSFTRCGEGGCGQVWVKLTSTQDTLVRWCATLGTQHLSIVPAEETQ